MVKISQNETHLLLSVQPEEKRKLGNLINALIEDKRGNILENTVKIIKKDHIWKESEIVNAISDLCKEQNINIEYDTQCQEIINLNESTKQQAEKIQHSASQFQARKNEENYDIELPTTFKRELKKYQKPCVDHLYSVGNGANFSVPGSGKTTIALAAYSLMKADNDVDHILVICPRSAYMSWEDEFEQCFERPSNTIRLNRDNIGKKSPGVDIFLSTYQLLSYRPEDFTRFLQSHKVLMILDESHYIKNGRKLSPTSWAKVVRDIAPFATKRMILSGTPCPNTLDDLWTQFDFLYPNQNIIGTFDLFSDYTKAHGQLGTYNNTIKNLYTRISKDHLDLPKPEFIEYDIPMDPLQTKIYNAIEAKVIEELLKESRSERAKMAGYRGDRGGKIVRLLQAASNPVLLTKNDKQFDLTNTEILINADISELIEKYSKQCQIPTKLMKACIKARDIAASGEKVIIWTSFLFNIDMIEEQLLRHNVNQNQVLKITGAVPKDEEEDANYNREKIIRAFKEDPKYKILIATPQSCSESVSLHINKFGKTVCKNAIYFDRTFNAAHYMQSKDRIHRIGMKSDTEVTYHIFRAAYAPEKVGDKPVVCHIDSWTDNRLKRKETTMLSSLGDEITEFDLNTTHKSYDVKDIEEEKEDFINDLKKNGVI